MVHPEIYKVKKPTKLPSCVRHLQKQIHVSFQAVAIYNKIRGRPLKYFSGMSKTSYRRRQVSLIDERTINKTLKIVLDTIIKKQSNCNTLIFILLRTWLIHQS